jgi:hypothetical protein
VSAEGTSADFVQRIAAPDVQERVEERFAEIKKALSLKRTEIRKEDDRIITKDFEYSIWCDQSDSKADEAVFFEELSGVNPDVLGDEDINNLFESSFDEMVLAPKKQINVEALIDTIEGLHSKEVEVDYDSDSADCVVRLRGESTDFYITPNSITVRASSKTNPIGLIHAFAATRGRLVEIAGPTMQLLT